MGFAMMWIMSFHFWHLDGGVKSYFNIDFLDFFFEKGYLGVDVFFFLSAYGCACSYCKNSLKRFYTNRLLRLFPIFPIYTLILVLFVSSYYHQPWWLMFVKQVTGLSTFTFSNLHIEWYMPAQVLVYALFPLVYAIVKTLHERTVLLLLVILVFSLFVFVIDRVLISDFAFRIPVIIFGTVTFFLLTEGNNQRLLRYYLVGALIAFLMINSMTLLCSLFLPLVLLAFSRTSLKLPFISFFSFIGEHSLEVYLAQNIALDHFMRFTSITNPLIKFPVCVIIIIIGSTLLYFVQSFSTKSFQRLFKVNNQN